MAPTHTCSHAFRSNSAIKADLFLHSIQIHLDEYILQNEYHQDIIRIWLESDLSSILHHADIDSYIQFVLNTDYRFAFSFSYVMLDSISLGNEPIINIIDKDDAVIYVQNKLFVAKIHSCEAQRGLTFSILQAMKFTRYMYRLTITD